MVKKTESLRDVPKLPLGQKLMFAGVLFTFPPPSKLLFHIISNSESDVRDVESLKLYRMKLLLEMIN